MSSPTINPSLTTDDNLFEFLKGLHSAECGTTSLNADRFVSTFFTPDCELTFANYPTVKGHDAARDIFRMQFNALERIEHTVSYFDFVGPDKLYQPCDVAYLVKGDTDLFHVKGVWILWLREDDATLKIRHVDIVLDMSKVTERMREKGLIS